MLQILKLLKSLAFTESFVDEGVVRGKNMLEKLFANNIVLIFEFVLEDIFPEVGHHFQLIVGSMNRSQFFPAKDEGE